MSLPYRLPPFSVRSTTQALAETIDWGLGLLRVPEAWRKTQGAGVRVAVLDTGIDEAHPDLVAAIDAARDFSGNRRGPIDGNGHGTHVAGIIAARRNDTGIVGVAPECRLLVAKVLDDQGSGDDAAVARGIVWAVAEGADILSLSLGSPQPSEAMQRAIQHAAAQGRFVICAAGNSGPGARSNAERRTTKGKRPSTFGIRNSAFRPRLSIVRPRSTVDYPARWPETVAVAAVDRQGGVAPFSSRGEEVDIAAPGEDVLSCWLKGGYARLSGTSMAAPFVSGVVALLLALRRGERDSSPPADTPELLALLRRTATDAGPTGHDPAYGWGLIDPLSLLGDAGNAPVEEPRLPPGGNGLWVWIPGGRIQAEVSRCGL